MKKILSALLALILVLGMLPMSVYAYPVPDYGPQNPTEKFQNGVPMSVAHRAAWRMGPENSLLAIEAAIDMGIDVAELDVKLTKDGVVVLSHDSDVSRCTKNSGNINTFTWDQLKEMKLYPQQGSGSAPYTLSAEEAALLNSLPNYAEHCGAAEEGGTLSLTRLDDAIDLINHRCMINLDHCFNQNLFVACYVQFRETDMLDHVFFKNSTSAGEMANWYKAAAETWNGKHPEDTITEKIVQDSIQYVYITGSSVSSDQSKLQEHLDKDDNLVMVEIVIADDTVDAQVREILEPWCKKNSVAMFVNTMWSGLCSTKPDTETTWAEMIERGYTAIQTDRPSELSIYLHDINRQRTATETIQAEHFDLFNYEKYGFSVPATCDNNLNKTVEGMRNGDWLSYDDIQFNGDEAIFSALVRGTQNDATLTVYLDGMTADHLVATIDLAGGQTTFTTASAGMEDTVSKGGHTVYLRVTGLPGAGLVSIDSFSFAGGDTMTGEPVIAPVEVTTEPGVAPQLPGTVEVAYETASYGLKVNWENIPESSYAQEGKFTVLGYIPTLKVYIEATVNVVAIKPGIAEDGLALWLDASSIDAEGGVTKWPAKKGSDATLRDGSFSEPKDVGTGKGLYFDGRSSLDIDLGEGFWDDKGQFTVLIYNSPEMETGGPGTPSQYYSVLYFNEIPSWGSAYFTPSQNEIIWRFGSGIDQDYGTVYTRPASIGSSYTNTAIRKDGTSDTVFVDGEAIYQGTAASGTMKNVLPTGYIGLGKSGYHYKGTICEILIYDRALSDTEIVAAQRYLAEKYADAIQSIGDVSVTCAAGEAPKLPSSVKVTYQSGAQVDMGVTWEKVDPRNYLKPGSFEVKGTLANGQAVTAKVTVSAPDDKSFDDLEGDLLLWFSAQTLKGSNGDPVSSWTESSGHVTTPASQQTTDNQPAIVATEEGKVTGVKFDGNDVLNFGMDNKDALNGLSGATAVIYSKPEMQAPAAINYNHESSVLYFGEHDWGGVYVGAYTNGAAGRFGTGTANYRGILYQGGSYDGYTTTVLTKNGGDHEELIINGQKITSLTTAGGSGAGITKNTEAEKGMLGEGKNNSYWKGTVSEIMVFNRALTDQELQLVYDYLATTYAADKTVPTDDLLLWFSAQTLEGSDGDPVSSWTESSGHVSNPASQQNTDNQPTIVATEEGKVTGVKFDGNDVLNFSMDNKEALNELSGATAVIYSKPEMTAPTAINKNHNNSVLYFGEAPEGWGGVYMGTYTNGAAGRFGTGTTNYRGILYTGGSYDGYTTTVLMKNGGSHEELIINGQKITDLTTASGSGSGNTKNNDASQAMLGKGKENAAYWKGTVSEIMVFNRALSDAELQSIYNYLNDKYIPVGPQPIPVTGVYLKEADSQIDLHVGDQSTLTACTIPANADNTELEWESSEPSVVLVKEDGKITAKGQGMAVITVTSKDGDYSESCVVRVRKTDSENLWEDIQNMVSWAEGQDSASYSNWDAMQAAIDGLDGLSASSGSEDLQRAYDALRKAKLALTTKTLTVTFVTGCDIVVEPVKVLYGQTISKTEINRPGYRLLGWYVGGEAFDFSTPITEDITLTAKWEQINSTPVVPPTPSTTVSAPAAENGDVDVSNRYAGKGQNVTVTVTPDTGYITDGVTVKDAKGGDVPVSKNSDGTYSFVMPEGSVTVSADFQTPAEYFTDAPGVWYQEALAYVVNEGLMEGTGGRSFAPDANLTRAQLVMTLYRLTGEPAADASDFDDVAPGQWFAKAVAWAAANKIVTGYGNGTFGPDDPITREQAAAILYRYAQYEKYDTVPSGDLSDYTDSGDIDGYALEAMKWTNGDWIITGVTETTLAPKGTATRAQVATILMRFCEGTVK